MVMVLQVSRLESCFLFWFKTGCLYRMMQLPDYHEVIEHPMDFSTVRKKLTGGVYANLEQFEVGLPSSSFQLL